MRVPSVLALFATNVRTCVALCAHGFMTRHLGTSLPFPLFYPMGNGDTINFCRLARSVEESLIPGAGNATLLNRTSNLLDESGRTSARYSYDAFGIRTAVAESVSTTWGFTGRRHERDFQSVYSRARELDVTFGRWLSVDPLGMPEGMPTGSRM